MNISICPIDGESVAAVTKSHAEQLGVPSGCQTCRHRIEGEPAADSMTKEVRATEFDSLMEASGAAFEVVWTRVDELVGRSTLTHELAYPGYLRHEILTGLVPSVEGIVAKLPADKPVVVIEYVEDTNVD